MASAFIRAFVCGHPIAHSRSPMIHSHWIEHYGLAGSYSAIDVAPADLSDFLRRLPASGLSGGNVTIPHKEAAFRAVARRDEAAERTGAVNTLWLEDGILCGGNTDVHGFAANLDQWAPEWRSAQRAVVLGAGGAARAVVYALQQAGIPDIAIANRTQARAAELVERFGGSVRTLETASVPDALRDTGLLVNTTPLGMHGTGELPADPSLLPPHAIVSDIVYVPLQTPLLAAAARHGLRTVDGLGMLLHQAAPAFAHWFDVMPEVTDALRALVVADLARPK